MTGLVLGVWGCTAVFLTTLALIACTAPAAPLPTQAAQAVLPPPPTPLLLETHTPIPTIIETIPSPAPSPTPIPSPTPCAEGGRVETAVFPSLTAGNMNVRIYLPPCYGIDRFTYPALYMLGGNIHTEAFWDELGLDETAEQLILDHQIPPLIIVMPDGGTVANNTSGGFGSYETVIVNDLIPFIENNYCAATQSEFRAIGGVSRGGYWALEIAFRYSNQFAGVGGHSAALLDIAAGPGINPQFTGLANELGSLRIYLDIGEDDYVIHNIRRLHEDMAANGIDHVWILNEGTHNEAYWAAHLTDYLTWYAAPWSFDRADYKICEPGK